MFLSVSLSTSGGGASDFSAANATSANPNALNLFTHQRFKTLDVGIILSSCFNIGMTDFVATHLLFFAIHALGHKRSLRDEI